MKHLKTSPKTTTEIALKGHHLSAQGIALGICITNNQRPVRAASSMKLMIHASEYSLMYQHHIFIRMALSCRDKIL